MINRGYLLAILLLFFASTHVASDTLTVTISGINPDQGKTFIGVFNKNEEFPNGEQFKGIIIDSDQKSASNVFEIPAGEYAIAAYQDKNGNQSLDRNFLGIPKEKYGFSGKKVLGQPSFNDARIMLNGSHEMLINIK